jgi:hypothetical protein
VVHIPPYCRAEGGSGPRLGVVHADKRGYAGAMPCTARKRLNSVSILIK